jgi:hypothetical protein
MTIPVHDDSHVILIEARYSFTLDQTLGKVIPEDD